MRRSILLAVLSAALVVGLTATSCGGGRGGNKNPITDLDASGRFDGGGDDGGLPDGGRPDASFPLPKAEDWTFYGTANGGPIVVKGVSADQGGNLWVAGAEEGLFLLRPDSDTFERFTMDDGLRPYGYPRANQGTITKKYLNVLSVAGGPAGTVFVGYAGMPPGPSEYGCEDNWDGPNPDPNIYKSGDADKVTLAGDGIRVVHYDISSGEGVVAGEPRGREKVCDVYRILYDPRTSSLWFGGNHAYAWGDPSYAGNPTCFGQLGCSGVMEHAHPLLNGYNREADASPSALTNYYYGLAIEPSGELWIGGMFRSQHCASGNRGSGFWTCESQALSPSAHIDWWPDAVQSYSRPSGRTDDLVSDMDVGADGSLWISSFTNGIAHRLPGGGVDFISGGLVDPLHAYSIEVDPLDGSVWVGAGQGGLTRIKGGQFIAYGVSVFGARLALGHVPDIQVDTSGGRRRILVAFQAGAIGVYEGD